MPTMHGGDPEGEPHHAPAAEVPGADATQSVPADARWWRLRVTTWRELLVFFGLLFCFGYFQQVPAWNEYSRYDLVRAIVEDGSTQIDRFQDNTGDKSFRDGHYYSDKAPGTSFVAVPAYAALVGVSALTGQGIPDQQSAVAVLSFAASGLLTAILAVLLLRFLRPAVGEVWALVVAVGFGLGSIAFPFATMLFGHAAATFFLFAAFYALWRARVRGPGDGPWLAILAGFLGGWAVLSDVSCALGVAILGLYALVFGPDPGRWGGSRLAILRRVDLRTPVLVGIGGILPAALLFAYNAVSFGSPLSLGYNNLLSGGFAEGMSQGILGVTVPKPEVLVDLLVGPRGLLRLAPWFVLVPLGLLAFRRRGLRAEVAVSVGMVVAFLLFNAGYYLPFGGWTPGPRFLTPALPFAAILVALAPSRVRPLTAILIAVSIVLVFIATVTMPNAPERYEDPLVELWLPRFLAGDLALTGAWLDWGIASIGALAVLLVGIALAEAGLVATFFTGRIARVTTAATTAGLVVLVLAFSTPLMPWPTIAMAVTPEADRGIRITETGAARVVEDGKPGIAIWASLRNIGPVVDDTKIVFKVHTGPGAAWISWNGDVRWTTGDRRVARVRWDASGEPPGDYPYDVRVVSQADEDVVYADLPDAGVIRLGP